MLPSAAPVGSTNKMMLPVYQRMLQMKVKRLAKEKERARRRRQARIARRRQFEEENSVIMYFIMMLMATSGLITVTSKHKVGGLWSKQRTSVWWDRIVNGVFSDTEWLENFRMRRETFQFLCRCLAPHIRKKETIMRQPVSVEKRVAITLWRLVCLY